MQSKYFIDYISKNETGANFYYQLVRRSDDAILYANENLDNVYLYCWNAGINRDDVVTY
jgi:hypothetical protein